MAKLKLPKFENEAEEAQWWFDHREEVAAEMVAASREGRLREGTLGRQALRLAEAAAVLPAGLEQTQDQHTD